MDELLFETGAPVYRGQTIYRDMADNLSKIKFPVTVTESYNPNVHYSLMQEGAPPPIYSPTPDMENAFCRAMLTGDFIIDALVTGQYLEFEDPNDMDVLADWIDKYLATYNGIDLTKFPDRKVFNENAKKAYNMLKGNITQKEHWNQRVNPAPLTLAEIIANL